MSVVISNAAFAGAVLWEAKLAVLVASALSAALGMAVLSPAPSRENVPATAPRG
jgi:Na+/H+ antiporter NhaA